MRRIHLEARRALTPAPAARLPAVLAAVVAVLVAVLVAGCATDRTVEPVAEYAVSGTVTAGPTCPVANRALDPACDDRPVPNALLYVVDVTGRVVAEVTSQPSGRFSVLLPEGTYELVPQPVEGLLGTAAPVSFAAGPGSVPDLVVTYDTGIR